MRITHNLHFTGFRVEDFTKAAGPGRPFVTIDMDHEDKLSQATLYLYDPAECDELIKAAAKAKRLLTGKPALDTAVQCGEHPYPDAPGRACAFHGGGKGPTGAYASPAGCPECKAEHAAMAAAERENPAVEPFDVAAGIDPFAVPANRIGKAAPLSALARYDRQAHLAWYERTHPDADIWPRQPLTDDEALTAIADYEGTGEQP